MQVRSFTPLILGCLVILASIAQGETVSSPLTFLFSLEHHHDGHVRCDNKGSPGYDSSVSGQLPILKQSLLCVFLIWPEEGHTLPKFCSLMGTTENMSCDIHPRDQFWSVSLSSETFPVAGECSVICQME